MSKSKKRRLRKQKQLKELKAALGGKNRKGNQAQKQNPPKPGKARGGKGGKPRKETVVSNGSIIQFTPGKKAKNFESLPAILQIALNICDPLTYKDYDAKRVPRSGNAVATAEITCGEKLQIDWTNATTVTDMLDYQTAFAAVLRYFECSSIVFYQNQANNTWHYSIYGVSDAQTGSAIQTWDRQIAPDYAPLNMVFGVNQVGDFAPHKQIWFAGEVSALPGGRFFYCPKTCQIVITCKNVGDDEAAIGVELVRWDPEKSIEYIQFQEDSSVASGATATFTFDSIFGDESVGAYYTFIVAGNTITGPAKVGRKTPEISRMKDPYKDCKIEVDDKTNQLKVTGKSKTPKLKGRYHLDATDASFEFTVDIQGNKSVFGHRCAQGFDVAPGSFEQSVMNGIALWFKNLGSPAFEDGASFARQMPSSEAWWSVVNNREAYIGYQDTTLEAAKDGVDVFLKPTGPESFALRKYHRLSGSNVIDSFWPIDGPDDYACALLSVAPSTTGVAQKGMWLITPTGEFTSNDPTREKSVCTMSSLDSFRIVDIIKYVPNVHTNGLHVKAIWNAITQGVRDATSVMKAAEPFLAMGGI